MQARVACLSPYDESTVRAMFAGRHRVEVVLVPPPPAQSEVAAACAHAELVIADRRHKHQIDRQILERMDRCLLIQQAAGGFDSIYHPPPAGLRNPVANPARLNKDFVAYRTVGAEVAPIRRSVLVD